MVQTACTFLPVWIATYKFYNILKDKIPKFPWQQEEKACGIQICWETKDVVGYYPRT